MTDPQIRIDLLGGLRARVGNRTVQNFETRKAAELLAFLALNPGRVYSREYLAELLWQDEDAEATRARFRQLLSSIRRALGEESLFGGERGSLSLRADRVVTDLQRAERLRKDLFDIRGNERETCLRQLVDLCQSELLPEVDSAWILGERQRWSDLYHEALASLADTLAARGEYAAAIDIGRQAVQSDPLRESARALLIRCLALAGRSAEALRQFGEMERVLREELDSKPSPESVHLAEQIRSGAIAHSKMHSPSPSSNVQPSSNVPDAAVHTPVPITTSTQSHLPPSMTRFFGRESEVEFVVSSLTPKDNEPARLLTITGIGGTGKTTLALEAARKLVVPFGGRVWFTPFADVLDPERMLDAVHTAMGIERTGKTDEEAEIMRAIGSEPSLLIVDNLEQLEDAGAAVIADLLRKVPSLRCLATSRTRLGLIGERELALSPLPTPRQQVTLEQLIEYPSVQLFVDRVQAVRPRFAVTKENVEAVADVCRSLDGLPLAIDLVAAWSATLTPVQIRDRLLDGQSRSLDLLVNRNRDAGSRHRSLRTVLEGSLAQLPLHLQTFFGRLAVFRGSFTVESAEQVCGEGDESALGAISELVARSLIHEDDTRCSDDAQEGLRFRLLQTVRAYAAELLESYPRKSYIEAAHATHFISLMQRLRSRTRSPNPDCLNLLESELDNLRAALNWGRVHDPSAAILALDGICPFLTLRGHAREWRPWLESLLAQPDLILADHVAAAAMHAQANLAYGHSDFRTAQTAFARAIEAIRRLGDRKELIRALRMAGSVEQLMRDHNAARGYFEEALTLITDEDDHQTKLLILLELGYAQFGMGDLEAAKSLINQSLAGYRAMGDRYGLATGLSTLVTVLWTEKRFSECRAHLQESVAIAQQDGHIWLIASGMHGLGDLARFDGDLKTAREYYRLSVESFRRRDATVGLLYVVESCAALAVAEENFERAARLAGAAVARRLETGSPLPPEEQHDLDAAIAAARLALGDTAFDNAFAAGRYLTVNQAVEMALSE